MKRLEKKNVDAVIWFFFAMLIFLDAGFSREILTKRLTDCTLVPGTRYKHISKSKRCDTTNVKSIEMVKTKFMNTFETVFCWSPFLAYSSTLCV